MFLTCLESCIDVNLLWITFRVCEITLFCLDRVLKEVRIALSMFLSSSTLSNGSITVVIGLSKEGASFYELIGRGFFAEDSML